MSDDRELVGYEKTNYGAAEMSEDVETDKRFDELLLEVVNEAYDDVGLYELPRRVNVIVEINMLEGVYDDDG